MRAAVAVAAAAGTAGCARKLKIQSEHGPHFSLLCLPLLVLVVVWLLFRIPSYTDRILWKPSPSIQLVKYDSVESIKSSDHRPVYATFNVKIKLREANDDAKLRKFVMGTSSGSKACSIQ